MQIIFCVVTSIHKVITLCYVQAVSYEGVGTIVLDICSRLYHHNDNNAIMLLYKVEMVLSFPPLNSSEFISTNIQLL